VSTRGVVACGSPLSWRGAYNHFDSYPTSLGSAAWAAARRDFSAACDALLDGAFDGRGSGAPITQADGDPLYLEWVYLLDPSCRALHVLAHREVPSAPRPADPTAVGWTLVRAAGGEVWRRPDGATQRYPKSTPPFAYAWTRVATFAVDGPEPDWAAVMERVLGDGNTDPDEGCCDGMTTDDERTTP
jgi:hypothetical protein